jgi:hypothetical protein
LRVGDIDDPVAALALLWLVGTLKLDQVRTPGVLLAQLETAEGHVEVGVALPDRSLVFGLQCAAGIN